MNRFQVQAGDRVAYSVAFLRSIGSYSGDMPQLRGEVIAITELAADRQLATVRWDGEPEPQRVLAFNLAHVGPNSRFAAC